MPWHTHRDRIADVAAALGIACGALGKIGRDLTLLAQSEVAEAFETGQRRLVVDAAQTESRSRRHRGRRRDPRAGSRRDDAGGDAAGTRAGGRRLASRMADVGRIDRATRESADAIAGALGNLRSIPRRCAKIWSFAAASRWPKHFSGAHGHLSRSEAMALVERLCPRGERDGGPLREMAAADPDVSRWLSPAEIDRALAPENFLGSAPAFVERVLTHWAM